MTATLTAASSPITDAANRGAWSTSFGGRAFFGSSTVSHGLVYSDDDGVSWNDVSGLGVGEQARSIAIAPSLPAVLATLSSGELALSTDGSTFANTGYLDPYFYAVAVAWSETQSLFVAVGDGYSSYTSVTSSSQVWTSPNGVAWTARGYPAASFLVDVAFSPTLGLWAAVSQSGEIITSPDGTTWTNLGDFGFEGKRIRWCPIHGKFIALITDLSTPTSYLVTSTDGVTWTRPSGVGQPFVTPSGTATAVDEVGSTLFFGGRTLDGATLLYQSTDGGTTWEACVTSNDDTFGTITDLVGIGSTIVVAGATHGFFHWSALMHGLVVNVPLRAPRFFEGYPWRLIFADIPSPGNPASIGVTSWAVQSQQNRQIVKTLDDAETITLDVDSADPTVNTIQTDGYPAVAQSKRVVYAFRREGGSPPWKCRAAGTVMIVEDEGDPDVTLTHLTCYDPLKYLEARPCVTQAGDLPGAMGFQSWGTFGLRGDQIITGSLFATISWIYGGFCFIDAGLAYGGTGYYEGTIEETDQVLLQIQQGDSVADVWRSVMNSGNCDIVLTPIYDVNRPGYTHELNVYNLAGEDRPSAMFAYDTLNRSLSGISRLHDATPGNFSNVVQYFVGQGGPPAPLQINGSAVDDFGYYWATQFFPDQTIPSAAAVTALAQQALYLARQGKRTLTVSPTPERAPIPLNEYGLGDRVPVYATDRLRAPITSSFSVYPPAAFRVQAIPITIDDDGIEHVSGLLLSPDWRTQPIVPVPDALLGSINGVFVAVQQEIRAARRTARRAGSRLKKPFT